jgi:hypothetical protein
MIRLAWLPLAVLLAVLFAPASRAQTNCFLHTPPFYQKKGGNEKLGPLPCDACKTSLKNNFSGRGSCEAIADTASEAAPEKPPDAVDQEAARRREEYRQRAKREAEERRRLEEDLAKFARDQKNLLDHLKGTWVEPPALKGLQPAPLELKGVQEGPLGMKGRGNQIDLGIKDNKPANEIRNVSTAWRQLYCGAFISSRAVRAALLSDYAEATYLNEQTGQALSGGSLGVSCPEDVPPLPLPRGAQPSAEAPQVVQLYSLMITSTTKQIARLTEIRHRYPDLPKAKREAHKEVEAKKAELHDIKLTPINVTKPEEVRQRRDLIAEAMAALQKAQQADTAADQAIREQSEATKTLVRNSEMFTRVGANPDLAPELLGQLQKDQPGPGR